MVGDIEKAMKSIHNYHQVWLQYGFTPEFYNIPKNEIHGTREGYPLRPGKMQLLGQLVKYWDRSDLVHLIFIFSGED